MIIVRPIGEGAPWMVARRSAGTVGNARLFEAAMFPITIVST
jgi:hypothetical protein